MKAIFLMASNILPKTRSFDYGLALILFIQAHRRLPRLSRGGINDAYFFIKTSREILDPMRAFVSDKVQVKQYVTAKLGDAYNVGTIAVLDSFEDAAHFAYPADCVIKPTHMSGEVIFRHAGSPVDLKKVRFWFDSNYYRRFREANYRHMLPRIIVEPYIFNQKAVEDYKIFCFHGRPLIIQVDFDRHTQHTHNLYTTEWELLPFAISCPIGKGKPRPGNLSQLIDVATRLSDGFNLIRIDLYTDGQDILVGEITNCHQGARCRFVPPEGEQIMTRLFFGESGFSPSILKTRPASHPQSGKV